MRDRPNLTPENLQAFMQRVRTEPAFQAQVLQSLDAVGFRATVEEFFTITDRQRQNLSANAASPNNMARMLSDAVRAAVATNGNITLNNNPSTNIQSIGAHIGIHDGSVEVDIDCSIGIPL